MYLVKFKYDFLKDFVPLCKTMNDPTGRLLEPGGVAPTQFFNPISTKGGKLCPPNNIGTLGFADLPTALTYAWPLL